MVFMNGDNDLDEACNRNVREMMKAGSSKQVNVLVLQDHIGDNNTQRHYVKKGTLETESVPEADMGSWEQAADFAIWGIENYPAKHYAYIISNHGMGWVNWLTNGRKYRDISHDVTSKTCMSTLDLGRFARAVHTKLGHNLDILGYDACLMGNIEVAYETEDCVDYIVFSEEIESDRGWPFAQILTCLNSDPCMDAAQLSKICVREFHSYYSALSGYKSTLSAIDCSRITEFREQFNCFVEILKLNTLLNERIRKAISQTQSYAYIFYRDLYDITEKLSEFVPELAFNGTNQKLRQLLKVKDPLILSSSYTGESMKNSHGLSVYFPDQEEYLEHKQAYKRLSFCKHTEWDEFLEAYLFPKTPVPAVPGVDLTDFNDDSLFSPGEKIFFTVNLSNMSEIPAQNMKIRIVSDNDYLQIENGEIQLNLQGSTDIEVPGFKASISEQCPHEHTVNYRVVLEWKGQVFAEKFSFRVMSSFSKKTDTVLVLGNAGSEPAQVYRHALTQAGIEFDVWDMRFHGKPDSTLYSKYAQGLIILGVINGSDLLKLKTKYIQKYLDKGGKLLITGRNIGKYKKTSTFYKKYLHAEYVSDDSKIYELHGSGSFEDMNLTLTGNDPSPDVINPLAPATKIFGYAQKTDQGCAGIYIDTGDFRVLYLPFGPESIKQKDKCKELMKRSVELLKE